MKKILQTLAYWGKTFAPGLTILAVLSIMALGSATLISEAHGGPSEIDASVLGTTDIDVVAPQKCVVRTTTGSDSNDCSSISCGGGFHPWSLKVHGVQGTIGTLECTGVDIDTCTVEKGRTCSGVRGAVVSVEGKTLICRVINSVPGKRASATCVLRAPVDP